MGEVGQGFPWPLILLEVGERRGEEGGWLAVEAELAGEDPA